MMEDFFQNLSDCLIAGDLEAVARHYTFPLVVYEPGGIEIHKTPEDSMRKLAERLISLRAGGATRVRVTVEQVGLPMNNRQPFDVVKTYLDSKEQALGKTRLRYFCRIEDDRISVELIEISEAFRLVPFPQSPAVCH